MLGPDYRARLDSPTPRTTSAIRHFKKVARSLCRVLVRKAASESGLGQAGLVATLRYDIDEAQQDAHLKIFEDSIVPALASSPGICAVSLLVADRAASGYVNAEQRVRGTANAVPPVVLMVEGWADEASFSRSVRAVIDPQALARHSLNGSSTLGFYVHQLTLSK